jgi:hypothetical protein
MSWPSARVLTLGGSSDGSSKRFISGSTPRRVVRVSVLTKPTRGRLALWLVLAFLWFVFLPQELAMRPRHGHVGVVGAVFWAVVLAGLLVCAWMTRRRRRAAG